MLTTNSLFSLIFRHVSWFTPEQKPKSGLGFVAIGEFQLKGAAFETPRSIMAAFYEISAGLGTEMDEIIILTE